MGIWEIHLQVTHEMLPYLAASGHNLYTKSMQIYLQQMSNLQDTPLELFRHFDKGLLLFICCCRIHCQKLIATSFLAQIL